MQRSVTTSWDGEADIFGLSYHTARAIILALPPHSPQSPWSQGADLHVPAVLCSLWSHPALPCSWGLTVARGLPCTPVAQSSQQSHARLSCGPLSCQECSLQTGDRPWPPGHGPGMTEFLGLRGLKQLKRQFMVVKHHHDIDSRPKHTPGLPVKRALFTCPRAQVRGRLQVHQVSRSYRGAPREYRLGDAILTPFPGLETAHLYLPEKSSYIHLGLYFGNCHQGDTPEPLSVEASRGYNSGHIKLCIHTHTHTHTHAHTFFKSWFTKVYIPNSLKLSPELDPSLWNTDMSWQKLWNYQE